MAKVKQGIKRNTATRKARATPIIETTGKVRSNVKNIKKSHEFVPVNSIRKSSAQAEGKSESLLVNKFRKTPISNAQNKNDENILPYPNLESKESKTTLMVSNKFLNLVNECNLLTRSMRRKGAEKSTTNCQFNGRNIKNGKTQRLKSLSNNVMNTPLESKTNNTDSKKLHCSKPELLYRKCCVKVKRIPIQVGCIPMQVQQNTKLSPPSISKRCEVKLQRIPVKIGNNTRNKKTNEMEKKAVEREESRETLLQTSSQNNNTPCILPLIDNKNLIPKKSTNLKENKMNDIGNSLIKNNPWPNLKHQPKLSLKKINKPNCNNVSTNIDLEQLNTPQDSIFHFEPIRNSTLLEPGFNKDKIKDFQVRVHKINNFNKNIPPKNMFSSQNLDKKLENTKEHITSESRSAFQNLANKSDEIENLLNSLDDDVDDENKKSGQAKSSPIKNKKFFHSKMGYLEEKNPLTDNPKTKSETSIKKRLINKKRKLSTKRSSILRRKDIYDFLSQTSDSDGSKHLDPAADIIKKLIDQGKVRVATNCRGKGRPMIKRKIPHKQIRKINKKAVGNQKQLKNYDVKRKTTPVKDIENQVVDNNDFGDNFDDDLDDGLNPNTNCDMDNINKNIDKRFKNNSMIDQEGTFSRLARSVLMNQAGRTNLERKRKSHLLEMVKKYISTPKNKQTLPETAFHSDISPILMPPPRPKTKASPWRVDENESLPRVFNFCRSPSNLPSFSSDYIPSTPRKENTRNSITKLHQQSPLFGGNTHQSFLPLMENTNTISDQSTIPDDLKNTQPHHCQKLSTEKDPSLISSLSSNDSNAENMPPSNMKNKEHNKNNGIFDLKQFPNPRRALTNRSPLKAINILEVVHLPPYKSPIRTNSKINNNDALNMVELNENTLEKNLQTDENIANIEEASHKKCTEKQNENMDEDLFGFEEYLSQHTEFSEENNCINENNDSIAEPNITIHEKLQDLRKLKPDDNELHLSLEKEKMDYPSSLFEKDKHSVDDVRQKNIKEMFCSTMTHPQPSTSKDALKELKSKKLWVAKKPNLREDLDLSELFKDPESETTFNENDPHRTYVRPFKRKRRLKENKYIILLESDESGDEENHEDHQKQNHSNDTDTSSENNPKKKRQRKLAKENHELEDFVEEFNAMCKEVESFELRVE